MSQRPPHLRRPTTEEIKRLAARHHMDLSDEELTDFADAIDSTLAIYERLEGYDDPRTRGEFGDRTIGPRPDEDTDPYNAVITFCEVGGDRDGPLSGYSVGLKDSVALAGVGMTAGTRLLAEHVAAWDATVAERLVEAGATITAKLNQEALAISASGEQSLGGPVANPHDTDHLAGGSSSGAGAAVAGGLVDVAIGTDTGGSIRIPAAWCGCVGLKPTFGLVPSAGVMGMAPTMDHVGPITRTASDCALVMDAIAGPDPRDPRGRPLEVEEYAAQVTDDVNDLTVGILEEGFDCENSDDRVDETVRSAASRFESAGASVTEVSVPDHEMAPDVHKGIVIEALAAFWDSESVGWFSRRQVDVELAVAMGKARRTMDGDVPPAMRANVVAGAYLAEQYHGRYYAKAQNLAHDLHAAYDEAFEDVDVLALPTTPILPHERKEHVTRGELIRRGREMLDNTTPWNVTGHPALSVPCGTVGDLPVGMTLVGPDFADADLLRAANALEEELDLGLY